MKRASRQQKREETEGQREGESDPKEQQDGVWLTLHLSTGIVIALTLPSDATRCGCDVETDEGSHITTIIAD